MSMIDGPVFIVLQRLWQHMAGVASSDQEFENFYGPTPRGTTRTQ